MLPFYDFIGYTDINLCSTRNIELIRLRTFLSLLNNQQYGNLDKPSSQEYQQALGVVRKALADMIDTIMQHYRQIKNKNASVNRLASLAVSVMAVRLEYARGNEQQGGKGMVEEAKK